MLAKLADEADALIQATLGVSGVGSKNDTGTDSESRSLDAGSSSPSGLYRLPVSVAASGKVLDEETPPTLIGRFTPGTPSPNHPTGHLGIDLQAPKGSPVITLGPGTVLWTMTAAQNAKGGLSVKIQHRDDPSLTSYYAHLDSTAVRKGQEIESGDVVGTVGNSGNAQHTSSHLHFETKINGTNVDPLSVVGKAFGSFTKTASPIDSLSKMADGFLKQANGKFLYHVTFFKNLSSIADEGLVGDVSGGGAGSGGYGVWSAGKNFLAGSGAVAYWFDKLEQQANDRSDHPLKEGYVPVVLRIPESKLTVEEDTVASKESISSEESYFTTDTIEPDGIEVFDGKGWIDLSHYHQIDTGSSFDEDEYFKSNNPLLPKV
jgi:hypothetical protein